MPENSGPDAHGWEQAHVPSCWNATPEYERYEGAFWFATDFSLPADRPDYASDVFLKFNAVNYLCRVWVNGREIGGHEGGYLPFELPVPGDLLQDSNRLVVMAENLRGPRRIPGELCDWFNYGGIVRDVFLCLRSPRRFDTVQAKPSLRPPGGALVTVSYRQHEPFPFSWAVLDGDRILAQAAVTDSAPDGVLYIDLPKVAYWSPDSPKLYTLRLTPEPLARADGFETRLGVREITVRGHEILLNGEPVKMQGVSLHEEQAPHGRCIPPEQRPQDVRDIKALGFNALRTAHYTHDEALLHAADEIGLLILEEIPVYWDLDYKSPELLEKARNMVSDMIARDFNHPSVILWSVGNEVPVEDPACDAFIRKLMKHARSLDATRIVTYVSCRFLIDKKTRRAADTACVNCYLGWYYGRTRDMQDMLAMARTTAPDKPWLMTEFGAGAKFGFRDKKGRARFSEDKQEKFLVRYIRTLNALPWVAGWFIWIYRDFRSPLRMNRFQKGYNRKGIVSENNEQKSFCAHLPALLKQQKPPEPLSMVRLRTAVAEQIEAVAYKLVQPNLAAAQKRQYDSFYKRDL